MGVQRCLPISPWTAYFWWRDATHISGVRRSRILYCCTRLARSPNSVVDRSSSNISELSWAAARWTHEISATCLSVPDRVCMCSDGLPSGEAPISSRTRAVLKFPLEHAILNSRFPYGLLMSFPVESTSSCFSKSAFSSTPVLSCSARYSNSRPTWVMTAAIRSSSSTLIFFSWPLVERSSLRSVDLLSPPPIARNEALEA